LLLLLNIHRNRINIPSGIPKAVGALKSISAKIEESTTYGLGSRVLVEKTIEAAFVLMNSR
jgi:hypothetical protein